MDQLPLPPASNSLRCEGCLKVYDSHFHKIPEAGSNGKNQSKAKTQMVQMAEIGLCMEKTQTLY